MKQHLVTFSLLGFFCIAFLFYTAAPLVYMHVQAERCAAAAEQQKEACRLGVITAAYRAWGVQGGMRMIHALYVDPAFGTTGCFRYAGIVGDLAYVDVSHSRQPVSAWKFPPETAWCSTGFFHEFLAAFVEAHPDPTLVSDTCTLLNSRLGTQIGGFMFACHLAAGHGFERAAAEHAYAQQQTTPEALSAPALLDCEQLSGADRLVEGCKMGAMETFSNFAIAGAYGLHLDFKNPLALCDGVPESGVSACYWAAAQLLGKAVGTSPLTLSALTQRIDDGFIRAQVFETGVAMMMNDIQTTDLWKPVFSECRELSQTLVVICAQGIVHGLFVNGEPGEEYQAALPFCASPDVAGAGVVQECYSAIGDWMRKLYPPTKVHAVCERSFPVSERVVCTPSTH